MTGMIGGTRVGRHRPPEPERCGRSTAQVCGRRQWSDRALSGLLATTTVALLLAIAGTLAGLRVHVIASGSMTPTLRSGDLVVTRSERSALLRTDDIVTFRHPGLRALVTHRVMAVHREGDLVEVTTKGDANSATETWQAPATGRIGRTVLRIPGAAPRTQEMIIRVGGVLVIGALGGYVGVWLLYRVWREPPSRARRHGRRARVAAELHGRVRVPV
jgi:signal peptidase